MVFLIDPWSKQNGRNPATGQYPEYDLGNYAELPFGHHAVGEKAQVERRSANIPLTVLPVAKAASNSSHAGGVGPEHGDPQDTERTCDQPIAIITDPRHIDPGPVQGDQVAPREKGESSEAREASDSQAHGTS